MPSLITAGDATTGLVVTSGNDGAVTIQSGPAGAKVNALSIAVDGALAGVGTGLTETATGLVAGIGVGQTWQNVLAGRSKGTTYTNTTGKPIVVSIYASSDAGTNAAIQVNGVGVYIAVNGFVGALVTIVPPSSSYSLSIGTGTLYFWYELR